MPFRSKAQMRYLYKFHPKIAAEFQSKTSKNAKLPQHISKSKKK